MRLYKLLSYEKITSRLVKGTDAGLYRLIPKEVVKVNFEEEVIRLSKFCRAEKAA